MEKRQGLSSFLFGSFSKITFCNSPREIKLYRNREVTDTSMDYVIATSDRFGTLVQAVKARFDSASFYMLNLIFNGHIYYSLQEFMSESFPNGLTKVNSADLLGSD